MVSCGSVLGPFHLAGGSTGRWTQMAVKGPLGVFACKGKESGAGGWERVSAQVRTGGQGGQEGRCPGAPSSKTFCATQVGHTGLGDKRKVGLGTWCRQDSCCDGGRGHKTISPGASLGCL